MLRITISNLLPFAINGIFKFIHKFSARDFFLASAFFSSNKWDRNKKSVRKEERKEGEGDKKLNVLTIKLNPELMAK